MGPLVAIISQKITLVAYNVDSTYHAYSKKKERYYQKKNGLRTASYSSTIGLFLTIVLLVCDFPENDQ